MSLPRRAKLNKSGIDCVFLHADSDLLNQYSPVPRARSSTAGKDATSRRRARSASTDLCRLKKF